ncbi:MAG: hypothetical protein DCC65_14870 [Planctomycetota bacterium]|nr:MAG: hypothetical protein DCC65_14870 [Planctomycetota bacterium]
MLPGIVFLAKVGLLQLFSARLRHAGAAKRVSALSVLAPRLSATRPPRPWARPAVGLAPSLDLPARDK